MTTAVSIFHTGVAVLSEFSWFTYDFEPPAQWVPVLLRGVEGPERDAGYLHPSGARLRIVWAIPPPLCLHRHVMG